MRLEHFSMIDRVAELDLDRRTILTEAVVPTTSTIFEGHFPGLPLMPGVLLLETMAQTSGWLLIGVTGFSRMPFLAGFKEAKLRAFVKPGDNLEIAASMVHEGSGFARTSAEIRNGGRVACESQITFRLVEFPNQEFRQHMEKAAAAIAFPIQALPHV
jgi:3-hydroxyacyl-[acyl-carrier-protein] dehydratase